jgi:PAS domain S-box-containing protein/diguanylate cyclase (GGDEF)-like protein
MPFLQASQAHGPAAVVEVDADERVVRCDRTFRTLCGLAGADAAGMRLPATDASGAPQHWVPMPDRTGERALWADIEQTLAGVQSQLCAAETDLARQVSFTDVLLETVDVGIVFCDAQGRGWVRNRAERAMLGLEVATKEGTPPDTVSGKGDVLDMAGDPVPVRDYPLLRALRGEPVGRVDLLLGPAGGPHREVTTQTTQIVGTDGDVLGAVSTLTDVTLERAARRTLAIEHEQLLQAQAETLDAELRFREVFDQAAIGAVIIGLDGLPTQVNAAACALLGRGRELLVGTLWAEFLAPGQGSTASLAESHFSSGHDTFRDERCYSRPDGTLVWVSAHLSLVRDQRGAPDYLLAQLADITERKILEADLDHRSVHDALTDLPNRFLFVERVRQALVEASTDPVAVVVVLLAGLHTVIDGDGYAAGDLVLKEIALRLESALGEDVTIAHLQPGQFAVLIKGSNHDSVHAARQALAAVGDPIDLPSGRVQVQARVGICSAPADSKDPGTLVERLIQDAASAAERAKTAGSDAIAFASSQMRREQEQRQRTQLLLRDALDNDTVGVAFQPVVDLGTGLVVGAEALLRISDRDGCPIPPQELIPVAEESGLIVEIGLRVLRLAAEQVARWLAETGVLLPVAVNVSAVQLESADFQDEVVLATSRVGLPPQALTIELTESVLLETRSAGIQKLRDLRDAGVELAIDDFGTGYASLSYLRDLPASTLKIDRSFVEGIPHDRAAVAIVASVIGLARNFGMTCIAEGIETDAQLGYLAERRVHGQGYLLGRPGPASAITRTLQGAAAGCEVLGPRSEADARDDAGDRRDEVADERDAAGDRRDHVGDERDLAALFRDNAGDLRDALGDQRDEAANQRDAAAETRDQAGAARDQAARLRDERAERLASAPGPATAGATMDPSSVARQGAARDRRDALSDRRAGADERTSAGIDRAAAVTDRDAGASERAQAELDRNIALADRGSGAGERDRAEDDRALAQSDRDAAADERGSDLPADGPMRMTGLDPDT